MIDDELAHRQLARIEDAGVNASAPRQQRWVDGWLVRLSPGKAKRARCIQAVAPGRLPVAEKLAICLPLYAAAGLRPYLRITPFSQPAGLDAQLELMGMAQLDDTRVMVLPELDSMARVEGTAAIEDSDAAAFVAWIAAMRGSGAQERQAHLDRVAHSPVPHRAVVMRNAAGSIVAGGQSVIEGDVVGLYDVFTAESERGRGRAGAICRRLLQDARQGGARIGYLQVDAGNAAARRAYFALGFVDAYAYHYRSPPQSGD